MRWQCTVCCLFCLRPNKLQLILKFVIQGGFVSGMLDATMSQYLIFLSKGKQAPLTLDLDVKFLKSCSPDQKVIATSKIVKKEKFYPDKCIKNVVRDDT